MQIAAHQGLSGAPMGQAPDRSRFATARSYALSIVLEQQELLPKILGETCAPSAAIRQRAGYRRWLSALPPAGHHPSPCTSTRRAGHRNPAPAVHRRRSGVRSGRNGDDPVTRSGEAPQTAAAPSPLVRLIIPPPGPAFVVRMFHWYYPVPKPRDAVGAGHLRAGLPSATIAAAVANL